MDIRIDFLRPLKKQFEFFEDFARKSQKKNWNSDRTVAKRPERSRKRWPLYLRIIDAEDDGSGLKQIGEGLVIPEGWDMEDEARILRSPQGVRDLRDRARELIVSWRY